MSSDVSAVDGRLAFAPPAEPGESSTGRYGLVATPGAWTAGALGAIAISAALFLTGTRLGIGVLPDTTRYMGMNEVPYDAPLYAWTLALAVQTGLGMAAAAKWVGLALVVANSALVWHLLARTTGRIVPTAIGTGLIILSPQFVYLHALALSEPLFLFFILATLLAFLRYLGTGSWGGLVGCAVLLGLCSLVRFTAPPLGAALALTLLVRREHAWPRRLAEVAVLGIVAGVLFVGWAAASEASAGHSLGREFAFNGTMGPAEWWRSLAVMTAWLLPDQVPFALRVTLLAAVLVAGTWLTARITRRALASPAQGQDAAVQLMPMTLAAFFVAYLLFMVLATAIEANLALSGRYAFPPYVAAVLLMTIVTSTASPGGAAREPLTLALACLGVLVLGGHVVRTTLRTWEMRGTGIGYAARTWKESPTVQHLSRLPAGAEIWSNAPDAVTFLTARPAHWLPVRALQRTGKPDPAHPYPAQIDDLRRQLDRRPGYLVFFDQVQWRPYYRNSEAELAQALNLRLADRASDGRIYTAGASLREKQP
ncbi:glycosyltransferase family 39 protein [Sphingomonas aerophila]|uniref:Glycosyltransferase RgtA/B/C/D-like domain-containing protein n=1 Tax=Sphingomonas aerophila TaxID=1344948 RepID=A0A7W9EV37_9SPHN|nr:hypothetical protein [Sphingomonas aerophila]